MSGGGRGGAGAGARVSSSSTAGATSSSAAIPSNVKKTIQHIKEITGNHSEDEIYSVLKECSMDPNETAQKLLLLDTFHEVKRKRDKKKENTNNKEPGDSRWKSGTQGRGSRGGRSNYAPRFTSHDAVSGKNSAPGRDSGLNQPTEKVVAPLSAPQEEASPVASSVAAVTNGPTITVSVSASAVPVANLPAGNDVNKHEIYLATDAREVANKVHSTDVDSTATDKPGTEDAAGDQALGSSNLSVPVTSPPSSTARFSTSDPILLPSLESRNQGVVGTIKREIGSHRVASEAGALAAVNKSASEIGTSFQPGKVPNRSQGTGKSHDSSQPLSMPTHGSRPSSNYNNRSQQLGGPQKVGGNKEWKPKPTAPIAPQGSEAAGSSPENCNTRVEANVLPKPQPDVLDLEEATSKLQKKLEDVHIPQRQHVIIPNHIHVPESERTKLSFGSFDASFGVTSSYASGQESEKSSTPLSEASQGEENVEEQTASNQIAVEATEEVAYADSTQSPAQVLENLSGEADNSSGAVSDYSDSKQEASLLSGGQQYSTVQTSPSYNFGVVPPMMGSHVAAFENSDSQGREISRLPNFVVQQPFDPASYYAQYYRSGADSDGRVSPFPSSGVPAKYNGNMSGLPSHTTQSPQEGGNPLVLSTTGPTPMPTQAAGLMQSSIAMTQQSLPVFRPPAGLHISHYPPNYIPYGHYFSPFYVPPPGIHQFLSNGAFPQQPQAGGMYSPAPPAAATGVKYPVPQYKPGNTGNTTQVGIPSGYVPYGASPVSYNPSSAATGGNTTTNEDLNSSQFKESNVYITGQQNEGSAVWIAAPGRDLSSLPANSFYNIPHQGQHVAFAPTQAGHGTFANMYHPAQGVTGGAVHPLLQQSQAMGGAVDMVGPGANVYQQPQHQQMNWPSNY